MAIHDIINRAIFAYALGMFCAVIVTVAIVASFGFYFAVNNFGPIIVVAQVGLLLVVGFFVRPRRAYWTGAFAAVGSVLFFGFLLVTVEDWIWGLPEPMWHGASIEHSGSSSYSKLHRAMSVLGTASSPTTMPIIAGPGKTFLWNHEYSGAHVLVQSDGRPVLAIAYDTNVACLSEGWIVLWRTEPGIRIVATKIQNLLAFEASGASVLASNVGYENPWEFVGDTGTTIRFNKWLREGMHPITFPSSMRFGGALAIPYNSTEPEHIGELCLALVRPLDGAVSIIRQDWYNHGRFRKEYEWVARMVWDPMTGRVFGDGLRLRPFVLTSCNKDIYEWLE